MKSNQYSQGDISSFLDYMLQNNELEKALTKWKRDSQNVDKIWNVLNAFAKRDAECGGLIVAVECSQIPTGADNITLFEMGRQYYMHKVEGENNCNYAMAFTSKERFRECEDTVGIVLFIKELFTFIEQCEELDGIILNYGKEGMVCGKDFLRAVLCSIQNK